MCGVIGMAMKRGLPFAEQPFVALMNEARIRGQHATGISWLSDRLHTKKDSISVDRFEFPADLKNARMALGHLRYSTSDLRFNQPNSSDSISLIHNGVVTQEHSSEWERLFDVKCETENDSEILLRVWEQGDHPLTLVDTSQACVAINGGSMFWWRNEQRPLYWYECEDYLVVASTKDIIRRALEVEARECLPCTEYRLEYDDLIVTEIRKPLEDLQHVRQA